MKSSVMLRAWALAVAGLLIAAPLVGSVQAQQITKVAPGSISSAPSRSGGEGGESLSGTVTVREATKENPILGSSVGQPVAEPNGTDAISRCLAISYIDFSTLRDAPTQIIDATVQPMSDEGPAVCVVNGYIAPQVTFKIWLPLDTWNGKYIGTGCGGRCGQLLASSCLLQYTRGYACLSNDLGHRGTTRDNIWAVDNVAGEIDFGFRATHVATLAGKAITEKFYGSAPKHAYFVGASTGGRQALVAAQRFPMDFDGVVSGEPAGSSSRGVIRGGPQTGRGGGARLLYGEDGKALVTPDEIRMLNKAVMARCDADDGLKDGLITDPRTCAFTPKDIACAGPKTATCLNAAQVDALTEFYRTGPMLGSEIGWIGAFVAADGSVGRYTRGVGLTYSYPYAWVFNDAGNPDIRGFKARGGKLILYTGWSDEQIQPLGPIDYYEGVERFMGGRDKTQDFFRLFVIPGQSHIPGNVGAESVDYVIAMENWIERGQAPDRLVGHKLKHIHQMLGPMVMPKDLTPVNYLYSRPHYPWPVQARYSGKGDPDAAESFRAWDPATKKFID